MLAVSNWAPFGPIMSSASRGKCLQVISFGKLTILAAGWIAGVERLSKLLLLEKEPNLLSDLGSSALAFGKIAVPNIAPVWRRSAPVSN
jgi:hypothetical protein